MTVAASLARTTFVRHQATKASLERPSGKPPVAAAPLRTRIKIEVRRVVPFHCDPIDGGVSALKSELIPHESFPRT